jgi:hypothetical protein
LPRSIIGLLLAPLSRDAGGVAAKCDDNRISTFLDLSKLVVPPFCQFRYWKQDAGVEMDHEVLEIQFGQKFEQLKVTGKGLKVTLGVLSS